jgi:uncharacterized coiled-coil protein SlyX
MNKKNFIKLARLVAKFAELITDKGVLILDGDIAVGEEVVTEDAGAVEDGEYTLEDGTVLVIKESKIAEIKPVEEKLEDNPTDEPKAPATDPKDEKIAELEAKVAEYEVKIAELENKIKELEDAAEAPKEDPVQLSAIAQQNNGKKSNALKYFE